MRQRRAEGYREGEVTKRKRARWLFMDQWTNRLAVAAVRKRGHTQNSLPQDQPRQYSALSPSLSLFHSFTIQLFLSVCVSLSLQCLLSKLISASQLRSQRGERHSELLPSPFVSPSFSFLPSLLFSCLFFIPFLLSFAFLFQLTSHSLQLHHLIPFLHYLPASFSSEPPYPLLPSLFPFLPLRSLWRVG